MWIQNVLEVSNNLHIIFVVLPEMFIERSTFILMQIKRDLISVRGLITDFIFHLD